MADPFAAQQATQQRVPQLGDARSGKLAGNLTAFGRALRRTGVPVDAARMALAQQAVQLVGVARKGDMAAALERVAGPAATALLDWTPDPAIIRVVSTWPGHIAATRARALGLLPDPDFETIVRDYIRENPDAIRLPLHP